MEQSNKWIVEQTVIRKMPEMEKPEYHSHIRKSDYCLCDKCKAVNEYKQALSQQPTAIRQDNGLWQIGQELTGGVDFKLQHQLFAKWNKKWLNVSQKSYDMRTNPEVKRIVAIPITKDKEEKPDFSDISDEQYWAIRGVISIAEDKISFNQKMRQIADKFFVTVKSQTNGTE